MQPVTVTPATMTQIILVPIGHKEEIKCDGKYGGSYHWKGHDFKIKLPPDCSDEIVTFTLESYLPNVTQEHRLVSAVFDITSNVNKFKKPVTISFPHWVHVKSTSTNNFHFLVCHNNSYEMMKGCFEGEKSLGSIKLSKPCLLCICKGLITAGFSYVKSCFQLHTHQITTSIQSQSVIAMPSSLEEKVTADTNSETPAIKQYLDVLIVPAHPNHNWRIYCIAVDNPTYLQVIL